MARSRHHGHCYRAVKLDNYSLCQFPCRKVSQLSYGLGLIGRTVDDNRVLYVSFVEKLNDAVIVQDMYLNETAREFGTIFLPACSSFEKEGTFMNAERRIQRLRQVLRPVGDSRPDRQIICQVARFMGKGDHFSFDSVAGIWEEIRAAWPAAAGVTYQRLEHGGLQWPCPGEEHPGTAILHRETFSSGQRASLHCAEFIASPEIVTDVYPFLLMTGRTLQQFNAGTMTGHSGHKLLRPKDLLDISSTDARNLALNEGDQVRIYSRNGRATLPAHITDSVRGGELFATFHEPTSRLNCLTGPFRDSETSTPEYKITAVRLEKIPSIATRAIREIANPTNIQGK